MRFAAPFHKNKIAEMTLMTPSAFESVSCLSDCSNGRQKTRHFRESRRRTAAAFCTVCLFRYISDAWRDERRLIFQNERHRARLGYYFSMKTAAFVHRSYMSLFVMLMP
jgi:hypothetical protein